MTIPLRLRVPDSTGTRLADVSANLTAAAGKPLDHLDTARIALEIGLKQLEACPDCSARRRCAVHLPGTGPQRALPGIPAPEAPEAKPAGQGDFVRIRDLYFAEYERARGAKPVFRAAEGQAIKRMIADLGADVACEAIRSTYADSYWHDKSTILTIAKDPAKCMHKGARSTVQRSDSPAKPWRKAAEVS